jgi:hypothetical protein
VRWLPGVPLPSSHVPGFPVPAPCWLSAVQLFIREAALPPLPLRAPPPITCPGCRVGRGIPSALLPVFFGLVSFLLAGMMVPVTQVFVISRWGWSNVGIRTFLSPRRAASQNRQQKISFTGMDKDLSSNTRFTECTDRLLSSKYMLSPGGIQDLENRPCPTDVFPCGSSSRVSQVS